MTAIQNEPSYMNDYIGVHIDDFLNEKKKRSNHTYKSYRGSLNKIFKELLGVTEFKFVTKAHVLSLTPKTIIDYFNELHDELNEDDEPKIKNSTLNVHMTVIKEFIKYLSNWDIVEYNTSKLDLIKSFSDTREEIEMIPFDLATKFMEQFKKEENGLEKYLIAKLAIETALRAQELLNLDWDNFIIDEKENGVIMKSHGNNKGKGNKEWTDKIDKEVYNELLQLKEIGNTHKLFTITYKQIVAMMDRANEVLNDTGIKYTFHSFKKLAVTMCYLNNNNCIDTTMKKAKHKKVETTLRYLRLTKLNVTGVISSMMSTDVDLYKTVPHEILLECLGEMRKDVLLILNNKINAKINKI